MAMKHMNQLKRILVLVIATVLTGSAAAWAESALSRPSPFPESVVAPAPSTMPGAHEIQGTITSVDEAKMRITLDGEIVLTIDPSAKVAPAALQEGAKIRATYEDKDGERVVTAMRVVQSSKLATIQTTTPPRNGKQSVQSAPEEDATAPRVAPPGLVRGPGEERRSWEIAVGRVGAGRSW